mmetsp:Transcript_21645/g.32423  ORF Transcript_21645/g.32423 Transcript_21645/m.32423 type:complete len:119 (+) Transcript_21645:191-547(+)
MGITNLIFTKLYLFLLPIGCYIAEGFSVSSTSPQSSVPSDTVTSGTYTVSFPNLSKNDSAIGCSSSKKDLYAWFNDLVSKDNILSTLNLTYCLNARNEDGMYLKMKSMHFFLHNHIMK